MEKLTTGRAGIWYDFFNKQRKWDIPLEINPRKQNPPTGLNTLTGDKEKISTLENLLVGVLQDIYFEEKYHIKTLSKIGSLVTTPALKQVFSENIKATEEQVARLGRTIELMDKKNQINRNNRTIMDDKNQNTEAGGKDEPQRPPNHTEGSPQTNLLEERGDLAKDPGQKDNGDSSGEEEGENEIKKGKNQTGGGGG